MAAFDSNCPMRPALHRQTFTQAVLAEAGTFPKEGLIWLGAWAFLSAVVDLIYWGHRPVYQIADYVLIVSLAVGLAPISFLSACRMVETPMTWRGAVRFFGTGAALVIPILLALGLMLLAAKMKVQWAVLAAALLTFASIFPITFLPGWPIWQVTSAKLIGPIEALRATKGFRLPLFVASCVVSGLNRAIPQTSSASDFMAACTIAIANGAVACMTTVVGLSIAVAAYRKMCSDSVRV